MKLLKLITEQTILLNLVSTNKNDVIREIMDSVISGTTDIDPANSDHIFKELLVRESKMSTGMQNGIAIPHCKSQYVNTMHVAIGISQSGIDFEALDGKTCHVFIMSLSPINRTGPHLQFLAEISQILSDERIRDRLLEAKTNAEVVQIITGT